MQLRRGINTFFDRYGAAWEAFMIALAITFVVIGFLPDWTRLTPSELDTLVLIDWGITIFFILEFLVRFLAAYSRTGYLRNHWLDLLAVVPLVRWVRVARIVRVMRVMRLLRLARIIDSLDALGVDFAHFAKLNGLQWMMVSLTAAMILLSVLLYFTESPGNPKINTYWDAFYTSALTWASAGYGDIIPVTTLGRICGIVLVITGLLTWGIIIANLSAFLSARFANGTMHTEPSLSAIGKKVARLEELNEDELLSLRNDIDVARNRLRNKGHHGR